MVARRGTERIRRASLPSGEELQIPVRDLLARCAKDGQADSNALEIMRDLLVSLEYVRVMMNPRLQVVNGQQAEIRSAQHVPDPTAEPGASETVECSTILRVTPHADNTGRVTLDVGAEITDLLSDALAGEKPLIGNYRVNTRVVLDKDKTFVCRLQPAKEERSQDHDMLYLLVRPRLAPPEPATAPGTVTATFVERDLLKVLAEIGDRTGKRIQVDETVKPTGRCGPGDHGLC
jgi:type II secretory pathway component GspD/PulD (secretin)